MNPPVVLLGSPHQGGTTDTAAHSFAEGMLTAGISPQLVPLRGYAIAPCTGCGHCKKPPHACVLATPGDQAEDVFALLRQAPLVVIAAPIYFYALPAHCKALIDRAQRFWAARSHSRNNTAAAPQPAPSRPDPKPAPKPALALLAAGRSKGNRLFEGATLSLTYFFETLNVSLCETRLLRGLETQRDLLRQPAILDDLRSWGNEWGRRLRTNPPYVAPAD